MFLMRNIITAVSDFWHYIYYKWIKNKVELNWESYIISEDGDKCGWEKGSEGAVMDDLRKVSSGTPNYFLTMHWTHLSRMLL